MRIKQFKLSEIDAEKAFASHQRIIEREKKMRELKAENIFDYDSLYKTQGYKVVLGDEDAEWSAYLSDVDIYRSRGEIHAQVKMKEKLVDEYGFILLDIIDVPLGRLGSIAAYSTSKEHASELITVARGATPKDWAEEMSKLRGKPIPEDGHNHLFQKYIVCKQCGEKRKEE